MTVKIFEASLGGVVLTEEADPPILAPRLMVQTLLIPPPCRITIRTVVTDVKN